MNKDKLIISSCDDKYFLLLKELFLSLHNSSIFNEYEFAVLDTGMTFEQITYLKDNKAIVKEAKWNVDVPKLINCN